MIYGLLEKPCEVDMPIFIILDLHFDQDRCCDIYGSLAAIDTDMSNIEGIPVTLEILLSTIVIL